MRMSNSRFYLSVASVLFYATVASADLTHYINSNVGDRASGLAGAYTAISDDASGCFYNPAGITLASANKFSASVNALSTSTRVYKGVLPKQDGGALDWEQESFSLLPNYFGIVQKLGAGMAGFSYAVPDSSQMRQKQTFTDISSAVNIDTLVIDINNYDKTYLFGPSYALQLSDSFSIGGTLYYYYRDFERIVNALAMFETGDEVNSNDHNTKTEQGIKPILGVIFDPVDNISIGITVSKLWILDSIANTQSIANDYNIDPTESDPANILLSSSSSNEKNTFPMNINVGIAWFYSPSLMLSGDLKYFDKIDDKVSVLNVSLGAEFYPKENIAIRTGVYTDYSNVEDLSTSTISLDDHVDIIGMALSGTLFSGKSSISVGVDWAQGTGESQIIANNNEIYDVEYNNITFHISTSFSY